MFLVNKSSNQSNRSALVLSYKYNSKKYQADLQGYIKRHLQDVTVLNNVALVGTPTCTTPPLNSNNHQITNTHFLNKFFNLRVKTPLNTLFDTTKEIKDNYSNLLDQSTNLSQKYETVIESTNQIKDQYNTIRNNTTYINSEYDTLLKNTKNITDDYTTLIQTTKDIRIQYDNVTNTANDIRQKYDIVMDTTNHIKSQYDTVIEQSLNLQKEVSEISKELHSVESHYVISPRIIYINNNNCDSCIHLHGNNMYIITAGTHFTLVPDCNPLHFTTIVNYTDTQITIHANESIYNTLYAPVGLTSLSMTPKQQFTFNYVKHHCDHEHGIWFLQFS